MSGAVEQRLRIHRRIVERLREKSPWLKRDALRRWNQLREKLPGDPYVLAWRALIELPDDQLAEWMLDEDDIGDRLRQVSPFVERRRSR